MPIPSIQVGGVFVPDPAPGPSDQYSQSNRNPLAISRFSRQLQFGIFGIGIGIGWNLSDPDSCETPLY
jgi:hypothetical protein